MAESIKAKVRGYIGRGVRSAFVNEAGQLILVMTDRAEINLGSVIGPEGTGIKSAAINEDGHLILTLTDGQEVDAGTVAAPVDATLSVPRKAADAAETGKIKTLAENADQRAYEAERLAGEAAEKAAAAQSAALDAGQRAEDAYQLASEGGGGSGIFVGSPEDAPENAGICIDPDGEPTETLPNPYPLTFKGAVEGSYDGSAPLEVEIPVGGSGGGKWVLLHDTTTTEAVSLISATVDGSYKEFVVRIDTAADENIVKYIDIKINGVRVSENGLNRSAIRQNSAYIITDPDLGWVQCIASYMQSGSAVQNSAVLGFRRGIVFSGELTIATSTYGTNAGSNGNIFIAGTKFRIWGRK